MSIIDEVKEIIKDEKYLKNSEKILCSEVVNKYNDMISKGKIKPRGNCLMPTSKLYTQNIMFNHKR